MKLKNYEILNSKQVKELSREIKERWGCEFEEKEKYVYLQNRKNNVYLINRGLGELDVSELNIDSIGLYFGEFSKYGFRLSIEGSEIIGSMAVKNILELSDDERILWLKGKDIGVSTENLSKKPEGFVILVYKSGNTAENITDYLGCGRINKNENRLIIENFVPKARRIMVKELL